MPIERDFEQAALQGGIKSVICQMVETAKAQDFLQDVALNRQQFAAAIACAEDVKPHILSGRLTIEQLCLWLDEVLQEVLPSPARQQERVAQEQPTSLEVPVPPMLEEALGYMGHARYVAFYWEPMGDECRVDDGQLDADAHWEAFLSYTQHRRVKPALQGYNLGSSESEAVHWLLLDRVKRELSVARQPVAAWILHRQWFEEQKAGQAERDTLPPEQAVEVLSVLDSETWTQVPPSFDEATIIRNMQKCAASVNAMLQWLSEQ
jgi:hypothetical protein